MSKKLFEIKDILHMEYSYENQSMKVFINGIIKYNGIETSMPEIKCSYEVFCEKYLEFIKTRNKL